MVETLRLQRFLAEAGVASRRAAETLIAGGQVKVNGRVVTELFTRIDPERDRVTVGGRQVLRAQPVYFLVNKPRGVVATMDEAKAGERPTLRALLPDPLPARLVVVGALDVWADGVVLVTNDGALAQALTHPSRPVPKTFQVKIKGKLPQEAIEKLRRGVRLEDGTTAPAEVDVLRDTGHHRWIQITTEEGRHHVVQRMLEAVGSEPLKVARVAFAGLSFVGVRVGTSRRLTDAEIAQLMRLAGLA